MHVYRIYVYLFMLCYIYYVISHPVKRSYFATFPHICVGRWKFTKNTKRGNMKHAYNKYKTHSIVKIAKTWGFMNINRP